MVRKFLFLVGIWASLGAVAAWAGPAADKISQRRPQPYSGYDKACGHPILSSKIDTVSLARIDARLGKVIVLDPLLKYPAQEAHRRFLIAHECAHHVLGHTTFTGLKQRAEIKGVENQELSADCWAAEALAATEFSGDARFMADAFYRKGLYSPGSGYPSGVQRSTIVYHCLQSALRRQSSGAGSDVSD